MANFHIVRQLQLGHRAFFRTWVRQLQNRPRIWERQLQFYNSTEIETVYGNSTGIAKQAPDLGTAIAILQEYGNCNLF